MTTNTQATIEDLYTVPENGKAEIVEGENVTPRPDRWLDPNQNVAHELCRHRNLRP
jgi:hypothetical protein